MTTFIMTILSNIIFLPIVFGGVWGGSVTEDGWIHAHYNEPVCIAIMRCNRLWGADYMTLTSSRFTDDGKFEFTGIENEGNQYELLVQGYTTLGSENYTVITDDVGYIVLAQYVDGKNTISLISTGKIQHGVTVEFDDDNWEIIELQLMGKFGDHIDID